MKLSNIFKKGKANKAKPNTQALDKNQLSKVIGGGDSTTITADALKASDGKKHFEVTA